MTTDPYRLWAKTDDGKRAKGDPPSRHPLPLHLLDVALVVEAWLDADPNLLARFEQLWPGVDTAAVRQALLLTAALHDVGKVYPDFQHKSPHGWSHGYGNGWTGPLPNSSGFDHGRGSAKLFESFFGFSGDPPHGAPSSWSVLRPLVRVAAGHHGELYADLAPRTALRRRRREPWTPTAAALLGEIEHLLGPPPPTQGEPTPGFLLLTAGLVSVADWFGSNSAYFPLRPDVASRDDARAYLAHHRAAGTGRKALEDAGLLAQFGPAPAFADLFTPPGEKSWAPRPGFQATACAIPFGHTPGPEIAIVEAPMGLGKTEIAFYLAAQATARGTAHGLYDALPTQATANAAFARVRRLAQGLLAQDDLAVSLAHGAKRFVSAHDDLRQATATRRANSREAAQQRVYASASRRSSASSAALQPAADETPAEVVAPSWLQPSKRALLAPIGVGTIDQALLGAMGVRHGFVRLFALARKVVILDEVHAYDAYTGALLEHLLRWLAALGTKVILLSATLPAPLRHRLLAAYGAADAPELPDAYPRLLHAPPGAAPVAYTDTRSVAERAAEQKTVHVEPVVPDAADDRAVPGRDGAARARTAAGAAWVQNRLARGGCVAWIRNTVREAQDAYRALTAAGLPVILLHARFARADRSRIEEDLLARLGPPGAGTDRPNRLVVVATQVLEQSVDLDFDAMLSDLAPVDLLLQRAGRLWRHDRPGRHAHTRPELGVLLPPPDRRAALAFGPSAFVYDEETLARSATLVLQHAAWTLPDACRSLVAELYERPWKAEEMGVDEEALATARRRHQEQQAHLDSMARETFLSNPTTPPPCVRDARRDASDAGAHVALVTRYSTTHSASAALFRASPAGPIPIGSEHPVTAPATDDYRDRLQAEEAVERASVSFPWYGTRLEPALPAPDLAALAEWYRGVNPYSDRHFVLVNGAGELTHAPFQGRYHQAEGLSLGRPASPAPAAPPCEDL